MTSPSPGSKSNQLADVSRTAPTNCVAVGSYDNGSGTQTLVESYAGSTWSVTPSPSPGSVANTLNGVFCTGASTCQVVGDENDGRFTRTLVGMGLPALEITTTSLPNGVVGQNYSSTLGATGGNPPYTWTLANGSGALPPGLKLDKSTGTISGVPKQVGVFSFTVEVLDTKTPFKPHTQNTGLLHDLVTGRVRPPGWRVGR